MVGNEAVDQLTKFDRALRDFSAASTGKSRGIDGMLITKWDTVDDKVWGQRMDLGGTATDLCLGWCCAFHDLRYRSAHHFRGLWSGSSCDCTHNVT